MKKHTWRIEQITRSISKAKVKSTTIEEQRIPRLEMRAQQTAHELFLA